MVTDMLQLLPIRGEVWSWTSKHVLRKDWAWAIGKSEAVVLN